MDKLIKEALLKEEKRQNSALMACHAMDTDLILTKSMRHLVRLTMQCIPT